MHSGPHWVGSGFWRRLHFAAFWQQPSLAWLLACSPREAIEEGEGAHSLLRGGEHAALVESQKDNGPDGGLGIGGDLRDSWRHHAAHLRGKSHRYTNPSETADAAVGAGSSSGTQAGGAGALPATGNSAVAQQPLNSAPTSRQRSDEEPLGGSWAGSGSWLGGSGGDAGASSAAGRQEGGPAAGDAPRGGPEHGAALGRADGGSPASSDAAPTDGGAGSGGAGSGAASGGAALGLGGWAAGAASAAGRGTGAGTQTDRQTDAAGVRATGTAAAAAEPLPLQGEKGDGGPRGAGGADASAFRDWDRWREGGGGGQEAEDGDADGRQAWQRFWDDDDRHPWQTQRLDEVLASMVLR
jgi:hypothetical protein